MSGGKVLLTGGTGFLGTLIAGRLLQDGCRMIVLVRARNSEEAQARLRKVWWEFPQLVGAVGKDITAMAGDVRKEALGLGSEDQDLIMKEVDTIINAAADLRLNEDLDTLRRTNVEGVRNLLSLGQGIHRERGLQRFSHISTAYVCGPSRGEISEDAIGAEFSSPYEQSKAEGERLLREEVGLPISVFRPVMVVGEGETGWIRTFNTLYYPLRLYLTGRLRFLPMGPGSKVNLVPGDMAVDAIVRITFDPRGAGRTVHLVPPQEILPTVKELMDHTREWASFQLGTELSKGIFLDLPKGARMAMVSLAGRAASSRGAEGDMRPLASYLEQGQVFRRDALDQLIGPQEYDWKHHLDRVLLFGTRYGFMHRSERTVHEQIFFRLGRERRAVRLFDMVEGAVHERDAKQVKEDILRAARGLIASGVRKGDRVAVIGLNSVRYLMIETAIGLAGAVSVPLYYTSPINEIESILDDSGAKLLFIGTPKLRSLPRSKPEVRCISFLRNGRLEGAMEWDDFLRSGDMERELPMVGFEDLATIRYTSGTTGRPQGVVFDHGNLRWMAETIAGLPPWKARNLEVSYLSFLPMNHVVEGILGTYSPYYAPTSLRLYFLEDFKSLPGALRMVRPSIFFSVPRFYEKVWDRFEGSVLGKAHGLFGSSVIGHRWDRFLGRTLLKRAGLRKCSQLIVGSAPCSDKLLQDLRSIGIEVHNAYGLTEAPLITLNRVGRNRIGTVGGPLPETELKVSAEGEVLVKGRQVMRGYHPGLNGTEGGWMRTGDLGRVTEEGDLVIDGRIKEMMIDSYGKSIMPVKVESALRQVPGVVDAMFIVDGRSYGTAILWVDEEHLGVPGERWDQEMDKVGMTLSNPERPKAWALLPYDLDIEKGEMTPNLKLRRKVLLQKYQPIVQAFYDHGPVPEGVLHFGREVMP